jgi:hypothetical protein
MDLILLAKPPETIVYVVDSTPDIAGIQQLYRQLLGLRQVPIPSPVVVVEIGHLARWITRTSPKIVNVGPINFGRIVKPTHAASIAPECAWRSIGDHVPELPPARGGVRLR